MGGKGFASSKCFCGAGNEMIFGIRANLRGVSESPIDLVSVSSDMFVVWKLL